MAVLGHEQPHNIVAILAFERLLPNVNQPLNIAMESLLWQESLQQPMKVLGAQAGFDTNR